MSSRTLVLNQNYYPLGTITWERAVTLLFEEKADLIEEYDTEVIRSVSTSMQKPAVIRLRKWVKGKLVGVRFNKSNVHLRDKGRCQYCMQKVSESKSTYDHVIPKARGGKTDWNNIVTCCYPCNQKKDCRTPEEARMKLNAVPIKPKSLPIEQSFSVRWQDKLPEIWRNYVRIEEP
jgi:5-methylcytosine-specific restriction endonuclease McrA